MRRVVFGSDRDKLTFAFRVHDHDGDGFLTPEEVLRMIAITMSESQVDERPTQPAEQLARLLFQAGDRDRDGRLSLDEFASLVERRPELLAKMTRSEAQWIVPNEDLLDRIDEARRKGEAQAAREWGAGRAPIRVARPVARGERRRRSRSRASSRRTPTSRCSSATRPA